MPEEATRKLITMRFERTSCQYDITDYKSIQDTVVDSLIPRCIEWWRKNGGGELVEISITYGSIK